VMLGELVEEQHPVVPKRGGMFLERDSGHATHEPYSSSVPRTS
jgi:hypothetical protein